MIDTRRLTVRKGYGTRFRALFRMHFYKFHRSNYVTTWASHTSRMTRLHCLHVA